jgi:hypothetical protein
MAERDGSSNMVHSLCYDKCKEIYTAKISLI